MTRLFAFLCTVFVAAGCATQPPIVVDYDEGRDFSGYTTFAWMDDDPVTVQGGLLVPRKARVALAEAVRDDLRAKGFVEVADASGADLGVSIVVGLDESLVFESTGRSLYGPSEVAVTGVDRIGRRRDSVVVARSGNQEYELDPLTSTVSQGSVNIGFFDLGSDILVWSVSGARDMTNTVPDGREAGRVVEVLLKDFPPDVQ